MDRVIAAAATGTAPPGRIVFAGEEDANAGGSGSRGTSNPLMYRSLFSRSMFDRFVESDVFDTTPGKIAAALRDTRAESKARALQEHDLSVAPLLERLLQEDAGARAKRDAAASTRRAPARPLLAEGSDNADRPSTLERAVDVVPPTRVFGQAQREALEARAALVFGGISGDVDLRAWRYTRMAAALAQRAEAMEGYATWTSRHGGENPDLQAGALSDAFGVYRNARLSQFYRYAASDLMARLRRSLSAPSDAVRTLMDDLEGDALLKRQVQQTQHARWARSISRALDNLAGETGVSAETVERDADRVNLLLEQAANGDGLPDDAATATAGGAATAPTLGDAGRHNDYLRQAQFLQTAVTSGDLERPFANFTGAAGGRTKFDRATAVSAQGVTYAPQRWAGARQHAIMHVLRHETFFDAEKADAAMPHSTFSVSYIGESLQWVDEAVGMIQARAATVEGAIFDPATYRNSPITLTKTDGEGTEGQGVRSVFVVDMGREIGTRRQRHLTLVFIGEALRILTAYPV
ncbi:hypothetical protein [Robbsia sp. KACC 23696]|uniref:hypothetical protein n=1 Tax=Robbsia sp. KACC 23696 TaxID=3149231 RepID=UPI00325BA158